MSKDRAGKKFESLTSDVFECLSGYSQSIKVEQNIFLDGPDGSRQIDVLMTADLGPIKVKTIIECRDYSKNLDVTHIDGLHSKLQDVDAQQAVLVTRKGFTKTARQKARRLGITLCTLDEAKKIDWELAQRIPIVVREIFTKEFTPSFGINLKIGRDVSTVLWRSSMLYKMNGVDLLTLFRALLLQKRLPIEIGVDSVWEVSELGNELYLDDGLGRFQVQDYRVKYSLEESFFFGYISDFPGILGFSNIFEKEKNALLVKSEELLRYRRYLVKISSPIDAPVKPLAMVESVVCPEFGKLPSDMNVTWYS